MTGEVSGGRVMFCRATGQTFTLFLEASRHGARIEGQTTYVKPDCVCCATRKVRR